MATGHVYLATGHVVGNIRHYTDDDERTFDVDHLADKTSVFAHSTSSLFEKTVAMGAQRQRKALVVGAGPVGALTALSLHRRGWDVEIWESREGQSDLRREPLNTFNGTDVGKTREERTLLSLTCGRSIWPSRREV